MKRKILSCLCVITTIAVSGCSVVGLGNVPQNRENYNRALDTSENEQFLLNIVRMHFGESPYFVSVDSITATTSLMLGGDAKIGQSNAGNVNNGLLWNFSPQVSFTQAPTVTYSPIQGNKFANGMITPLSLDKVYILLNSGYDPTEIFKLVVARLGSLDNGMNATYSNAKQAPDTTKFDNFLTDIDAASKNNKVTLSLIQYESRPAIVVVTNDSTSAKSISADLGLSKTYSKFIFAQLSSLKAYPENVIPVRTRSFFGVTNILSKGVDNPYQESQITETNNKEAMTALANPSTDWSNLTARMMHLKFSNTEPENAVAKVKYEGIWYYIDVQDHTSATTLTIMKLIYSLQMGEVNSNLPIITIPVAY